jgi:hypothetical protein
VSERAVSYEPACETRLRRRMLGREGREAVSGCWQLRAAREPRATDGDQTPTHFGCNSRHFATQMYDLLMHPEFLNKRTAAKATGFWVRNGACSRCCWHEIAVGELHLRSKCPFSINSARASRRARKLVLTRGTDPEPVAHLTTHFGSWGGSRGPRGSRKVPKKKIAKSRKKHRNDPGKAACTEDRLTWSKIPTCMLYAVGQTANKLPINSPCRYRPT